MEQALAYMLPLFLFMLIPVWIPLIAIVAGAVMDRVRPPVPTEVESIVDRLKAYSVLTRAQARTVGAAGVRATAKDDDRLAA